ncbi:MAG: hypothetical protein QW700_08135 [Desulfurococcaceae archaeon]
MQVPLEYLAVGLLILTILVAFNHVVGVLNTRLEPIREEQLYTVAERLMDKILLTPGYPEDWGTNITVTPGTLKDFGLALMGSRSPYILDPDKVMRLANLSTLPNPLLINSSMLAELLALKDSYGFHLVMRPALYVEIEPTGWYRAKNNLYYPASFRLNLTNYYGVGVPNGNITVMYVIVRVAPSGASEGQVEAKSIFVKSCLTNAVGFCNVDFTRDVSSFFSDPGSGADKFYFPVVIAHASWQGFTSVAGYTSPGDRSPAIKGYIIGNYVFVHRDVELFDVKKGSKKSGAAHVKDELLQAVPMYGDLLNFTTVQWCRDSQGNFRSNDPLCNAAGRVLPSAPQWYLIGYIEYVEPLSSHVFIFAKWRGNPVAIIIDRIPRIDISYGGGAKPANSVTLRRLAVLYNYPYVVELTIWRRVEGWP